MSTKKAKLKPPARPRIEAPPEKNNREIERKDRVLQARVPRSLYDDLVRKARRLRVPVSNLVRNILEDSAQMVGNLVDGGMRIAEAMGDVAGEEDISAVVGWQPMIANRSLACARCGAKIEKGGESYLSVGAPGDKPLVICGRCKCEI